MTIRAFLLLSCSAALMAGPAQAQTSYGTGSSPYSQPSSATYQRGDAPLPELSPDRIAADVVTEFNPRTGARERVAPTFDPFEMDDRLAGSVNLRSTDVAYDLDNRLMQDGVLLEIKLYYNDDGNREFGRMRDGVFLNGEPVPIIRRDSRELECSSRVTETIYTHDRYYAPGYGGLFRTRPRYGGHYGYDRFWGGFGYYGGGYDRPYRPHVRRPYRRPHVDRPRRRDRVRDPAVGAPRYDDNGRRRVGTDYMRNGVPVGSVDKGGRHAMPPATQPPRRRPRRTGNTSPDVGSGLVGGPDRPAVDRPRTDRPRADRPRTDRPRRDRPRTDRRRVVTPTVTPPRDRPEPTRRRPDVRKVKPKVAPPVSRVRPATDPVPRPAPRPVPRATPPKPQPPKPKPRATKPDRSDPVMRRPSPRRGGEVREQLQLFPNNGYGDSVVVRTDWDCAREDQLVLFIPNDRLDAARFDGLTLMIRDTTFNPSLNQTTVYDERPLYIPPNYIEGFQIAKRQG